MSTQHIVLLAINVVGGVAVLWSYVAGLRGRSGGADALWGGVPARIRPVYFVSMILSAIGYLASLYLIFFVLAPGEVQIAGRSAFAVFIPIYVLILFPSAVWMPFTDLYVQKPGPGKWAVIRAVLLVVGLASIALLWAFLALDPRDQGVAYWFAVVGSAYFAFHTFILDALLWAALFRRRS